jgi:hypothetical protein
MVRMFVFTTAVLLTSGTVVLAQVPPQPPPVANPLIGQGTEQERAACHPDVVKYCKELVKDNDQSDVFAILSCLQTNRSRISAPCQEVLAGHGQ